MCVCWILLLVFVQRGLQQTQRIDQTCSETQLLPNRTSQADPFHTSFTELELLLSLFADQLCLHTNKNTHRHA